MAYALLNLPGLIHRFRVFFVFVLISSARWIRWAAWALDGSVRLKANRRSRSRHWLDRRQRKHDLPRIRRTERTGV